MVKKKGICQCALNVLLKNIKHTPKFSYLYALGLNSLSSL